MNDRTKVEWTLIIWGLVFTLGLHAILIGALIGDERLKGLGEFFAAISVPFLAVLFRILIKSKD